MRRTDSPAVEHPWALRAWRTLCFGAARLTQRSQITARAAPFNLTFRGLTDDCITRHIYRKGAHEPALSRYVIENVRLGPHDIAFDVGANIGWYSVLLDRLSAPGARIFAFEPDPLSYGLLQENLAANHAVHVRAVNVAVGERPGIADLHRYEGRNNGRHTLMASTNTGGDIRVPVTSLAAFCDTLDLNNAPIRFMKVDVEGYEYFVLRGAAPLLARCECLLLEYSPVTRQAYTARDVLDLLNDAGLRPHCIDPWGLAPVSFDAIEDRQQQCDLILLRK